MTLRQLAVGTLALVAVLPAIPAHAGDAYTAADIAALIEQENWSEALEHLKDIPPSKRNADWQKWLEKAAVAQVTSTLNSAQGYEAMGTAQGLLGAYADLKKSKDFMKVRGEAGLKFFDQCYQNPYGAGQCSQDLISFVAADPNNHELAFRAGQMTRIGAGYGPAAILFEMAFRHKEARKNCADRQVVIAVSMVLGNLREGDPPHEPARKVAFEYCYDPLKKDLLAEFMDGGERYLRATCPTLKKKKALTAFQVALCDDALAAKK